MSDDQLAGFRTSPTLGALMTALAKAQGELQNPGREQTANVRGKDGKPGYEYKYADLAQVLNAVRPVLSKHGIALLQVPFLRGRMMLCATRLALGEEWIETDYPVSSIENGHQAIGSALTYARRYSAMAMTGIMGEREDDEAGSAPPAAPRSAARQEPPPRLPPQVRTNPEDRNNEEVPRKTVAQARRDGDFELLRSTLYLQKTEGETIAWAKANKAKIDALPNNWIREMNELYRTQRAEQRAKEEAEAAERALDRGDPRTMFDEGGSVAYDLETGEIVHADPLDLDDDLPPGLRSDYATASGR